jgi:hypothetical protein
MLYAVGRPGSLARAFYEGQISDIGRQVQAGEVAVPVAGTSQALIASNGASVTVRTPLDVAAIDTAVQLATAFPIPAGVTWTFRGAAYTGPQSLTIGKAGIFPLVLTGAQSGTAAVTVMSAADYETWLLAKIDADREANEMQFLTPGGAKKYVYNRKAAEAIDARGLVVSLLNALSLTDKQKRFPYAQAEAALTGDALSVVLGRYEAAMNTSALKVAALEAIAIKAKRDVRAATSSAAKLAAAKVTWTA